MGGDHQIKLDKVAEEYNSAYYDPDKAKLNELYGKKLMKKGHAPGFPGA
jgi:hypothetical protein